MSLAALLGIAAIAICVSFAITLPYRFLINQAQLRELKKEIESLRTKMAEARRAKDEKQLKVLMERSFKLSNQQLMWSLKPMAFSIAILIAVLSLMRAAFPGYVFKLPFWLPERLGPIPFFGPDVGWFGLYIIISIPATIIFRKLLGAD